MGRLAGDEVLLGVEKRITAAGDCRAQFLRSRPRFHESARRKIEPMSDVLPVIGERYSSDQTFAPEAQIRSRSPGVPGSRSGVNPDLGGRVALMIF